MAITNAQQYQQLVNPPMKGNKRPGYRGSDMGQEKGPETGRAANTGIDRDRGSVERDTGLERERQRNIAKIEKFKATKPKVKKIPPLGPIGIATNLFNKQLQKFSDFNTAKNRAQFEKAIRAGKIKGLNFGTLDDLTEDQLEQKYQDYMDARMANEIDAFGNPIGSVGGEGGVNQVLPVDTTFAQIPSNMNQETDTTEEDEGLRLAFRADGGPIGGEYDFESARQMYGLGKLVKKATRAVKKIAKSPIGKAALLYGGFKGFQALGGAEGIMGSLFGQAGSRVGQPFVPFKEGLLTKLGLTKGGGSLMPTALGGILGASVIAGALTPEQEEEAQKISDETGIDIAEIRANPDKYLARAFRAGGGLMRIGYQEGSKEPVAKKTMPLLDMDGMEKDYRETGGFVDMGRMEKADDVPARLSKNEFVFTADAVRNAGDGSVDKGAEVMYNMMKNLEAGGKVSEESQGLEGARRMFQTSQRLEEVL